MGILPMSPTGVPPVVFSFSGCHTLKPRLHRGQSVFFFVLKKLPGSESDFMIGYGVLVIGYLLLLLFTVN